MTTHSAKLSARALGRMLASIFTGACDGAELSAMNAVHAIIEKEGFQGLDGLLNTVAHDPIDFLLVAAPGFDREMKIATGRTRDEWLSIAA